jgi:hypothetical protein
MRNFPASLGSGKDECSALNSINHHKRSNEAFEAEEAKQIAQGNSVT